MPSVISTDHRIGLLSTYPPKHCGLATFAAALESALRNDGHRVEVVRIDDSDDITPMGPTVVARLVNGVASSVHTAAEVLSECDVALIQHEYGIYGGVDGDEVIDVLELLEVPALVILHTVPLRPTAHQRSVLETVCALAARVVVMTETAKDRLLALYDVVDSDVVTIPHGASMPSVDRLTDLEGAVGNRPQLLTWGLLGPGKGVEHTIDALAMLGDMFPRPRYTVAGITHPKVFAARGDTYRHSLITPRRRCELRTRSPSTTPIEISIN